MKKHNVLAILIIFGVCMGNTCKFHENNDVPVNTNPPRIARWILAYKNRGETLAQKFLTFRNSSGWISTKTKTVPEKIKIPELTQILQREFSHFPDPDPPGNDVFGSFGDQTFF